MKKVFLFLFLFVLFSPSFVFAHPGRTASDGCHYCRTNCDSWGVPWNERHCHGGGSTTNEQPPAQQPTSAPVYQAPVNTAIPLPTWTTYPTRKPLPTATPRPTITPKPTLTPTPTIEPMVTEKQMLDIVEKPTETPVPTKIQSKKQRGFVESLFCLIPFLCR